MDPIVLLLAAQLLIITAILLTTSKSKISNPVFSASALLKSYLGLAAEGCREEDCPDADGDGAAQEEGPLPKTDELVIAEKGACAPEMSEDDRNVSGGKTKRKKKPNLKFNEQRPRAKPRSSLGDGLDITEAGFASSSWALSFKFILSFRFIRWAAKLVVKRPFKAGGRAVHDLDAGRPVDATSRVQQAKPIESTYLVKIIAARKSEKMVRIKVARLNMAILKARGTRPLQVVPELAEQDA